MRTQTIHYIKTKKKFIVPVDGENKLVPIGTVFTWHSGYKHFEHSVYGWFSEKIVRENKLKTFSEIKCSTDILGL